MVETWHKVNAGEDLCLCCCVDGEHMGPEFLATVYDLRDRDRDVLADAIIRDHEQAQSLRTRYGNLIEHMTTILRAVRKDEGEQLSHQEIAERVVEQARLVEHYADALKSLRYQFSHGMYLSPSRRAEAEAFVDEALNPEQQDLSPTGERHTTEGK